MMSQVQNLINAQNLINGLDFSKKPVLLAPMSGVTDRAFRHIVQSLGHPVVVSEMIASGEVLRANKTTLRMMGVYDADHKTDMSDCILQLAGHDPHVMADVARFAIDQGAPMIDINMGCPAKKVVHKYCGSALMRDPDLARRLMRAVVRAVPVPVSVKMRLGWDHSTFNAPDFARMAEQEGLSFITVHGRTRMQKYTGHADWQAVRKVCQSTHLPVIVNGDITSFETIDRALADSGAQGVMIGRGALGRPWFLAQAQHYLKTGQKQAEPSLTSIYHVISEHLAQLILQYGSKIGVIKARKHMGWYMDHLCHSLPAAQDLKYHLLRSDTPGDMKQHISRVFETEMSNAA